MTKSELKKQLEIFGDDFYSNTCYKLQFEIIKRVVNCKNIDEFTKITLINQYSRDLISNDFILNIVNNYNK